MKKVYFTIFYFFLKIACHAQTPSNLDMLQGYWKQDTEEDINFYKYYEGHNLFEIVDWGDHVSVSKYFVFFADNISDSISVSDLSASGGLYAFFDDDDVTNNNYVAVGSNIYSFDLEEDYFSIYANSPTSHHRIDSPPSSVRKAFIKQKYALDRSVIFDFVPSYLRNQRDALPVQVKAVSEKVYFYTVPQLHYKSKSFVIKGDYAYVLYQNQNWYHVVYRGSTSSTSGWVKKLDVEITN